MGHILGVSLQKHGVFLKTWGWPRAVYWSGGPPRGAGLGAPGSQESAVFPLSAVSCAEIFVIFCNISKRPRWWGISTSDPQVASSEPQVATRDPRVATSDPLVATSDPQVAPKSAPKMDPGLGRGDFLMSFLASIWPYVLNGNPGKWWFLGAKWAQNVVHVVNFRKTWIRTWGRKNFTSIQESLFSWSPTALLIS